jgi:hypothetical protein
MHITRIYADKHGESHFADAEVPLTRVSLFSELPPFRVSRFNPPTPVKLFAVPSELDVADWHTAPMRQLAIALNGTVEYETSDGEARRLAPAEIVLVEDTWGRGHVTRFIEGEHHFLHIPVPDDWTVL